MVIFDRIQAPGIPATDEITRKGSPGATIAAVIASLFVLPGILLVGMGAVALFVLAVSPPFAPMRTLVSLLLAFLMSFFCLRWVRWLHSFVTRPSYARAVPLALILLLFYLALPNFLTRRGQSSWQAATGNAEMTRAAMAAYAADSPGNTFPATIANWRDLTRVVNDHGATLRPTEAEQGIDLRDYTAVDSNGDGIFESYTMRFCVQGSLIVMSPDGIDAKRPETKSVWAWFGPKPRLPECP